MHNIRYRLAILCWALLTQCYSVSRCTADDTFATREVLANDVRIFNDSITDTSISPSTVMGARDDSLALIAVDSEFSSFLGNGMASGLSVGQINTDGSIRFVISGAGDLDFDGLVDSTNQPHTQQGFLDVFTQIFETDDAIDPIDILIDEKLELIPGEVIVINRGRDFGDADWPVTYSYEADIDNVIGGGMEDATDFLEFTGFTPGKPFKAEIMASEFDTLIGWFTDEGVAFEVNDDIDEAARNFLSRIDGFVPAGGSIIIAVTGHPNFDFDSIHGENGTYQLTVDEAQGPGDLNYDGAVNPVDFRELAGNFGLAENAVWANGDFDFSGSIGLNDIVLLQANFDPIAAASPAAVPEPETILLALILLAVLGLAGLYRRSRQLARSRVTVNA